MLNSVSSGAVLAKALLVGVSSLMTGSGLSDLALEQESGVEAVEADDALAENAHFARVELAEGRGASDRVNVEAYESGDHRRVVLWQREAFRVEVEQELVLLITDSSLLIGGELREPE